MFHIKVSYTSSSLASLFSLSNTLARSLGTTNTNETALSRSSARTAAARFTSSIYFGSAFSTLFTITFFFRFRGDGCSGRKREMRHLLQCLPLSVLFSLTPPLTSHSRKSFHNILLLEYVEISFFCDSACFFLFRVFSSKNSFLSFRTVFGAEQPNRPCDCVCAQSLSVEIYCTITEKKKKKS